MSEALKQAAAYDLIDRFLRNNLYDDDYAKYSDALEAISQPAPSPQPAVPVVSDEQIIAIKKASKATNPTKPWGDTLAFARAILALQKNNFSHERVPMTEVWIDSAMCLADAYADACFDQGLNQRTEDPNPEAKREKLFEHLRHHGITTYTKKETP